MAKTSFVLKGQAAALIATGIALAWRLALDPFLGDHLPYVTFFMAIVFATWYAGLAASLTATLLGGLAAVWFFIPPRFSLAVSDAPQLVGLVTYGMASLTFVAFGQVMNRARQRAEELAQGLRVTEERLTLAQQASQIGSFDWNLETGVNTWSPELYDMYGIRPEEFGHTQGAWERYLHPDDRDEMLMAVEQSRSSGVSEDREFRIIRPNGEIRWLVGRWRWISDRSGHPVRLTGVNIDITQRKQTQEELRRSEAELSEFFEHASLGIHWVSPDGTILRVNQAELDLLGYSREEYVGRQIAEFHVDEPVISDILQRLASGETLREYPARLRCKDGSIRDVLINSNVRFEDSRFVHTRCFTRDVTNQKRAEEGLRQSEARTRAIFESTLDALITMDAEGRVQDWNPAAEQIFGYSQLQAVGQCVAELIIPPHLRARHKEALRRYLDTGEATMLGRRIQMPALKADGTEFPVEFSIAVTRRSGMPPFFTAHVRDISDRLRSELDTAHLAAIVASSGDAIISKTLKGIVTTWNDAAEQLFGYKAEEMIGQPVIRLIPAEAQDQERDILSRISRGERIEHYETVRCRKDGSRVNVSLAISPLFDAHGKVIGASKIARDITQPKLAERAMAHLAAIVTSSDDAIISKDLNGTVMSWNLAAERLFGYRADEMIGQSVIKLIPEDRHDEERRILDMVSRGEVVETYETIRRRKDGTDVHVSLTVSPLFDGQGRVIGASKIARDITEQVQHEQALTQSRERLRQALQYQEAIFSNIGEGLYTVNRQGLVVSMNQAAERLFGWTKDELVGRKMHDVTHHMHPNGRPFPAADCAGLQVFLTGVSLVNQEDVFIRRDGSFFQVVYSASPIRSGDEITGLVVVFRDVTEEKRAEDALRDRDRALTTANDELVHQKAGLAEANKELQSFSYSVSHDLRAPLRTIDAYVRIVEEDHGPELNDEVRRCLGIVKKAAGQAGELIDDLLEFSRLGRIGMDLRPTKMTELAREAAEEYNLTQYRPAVDLTIRDLPTCNGDWRLLKLVWANLLSNAFKFTRDRASAHIEIGWLPDDRKPGACVYYVKDNGVGFDMKYVHKLFGVFQRLHLKDEFEGTGVGLAIVQRIVQRHGGRVWAEGKPDGGATFFFSLRKAAE